MEIAMKAMLPLLLCLVPLVGFAQTSSTVKLQGVVTVDTLVNDADDPLPDALLDDDGNPVSYQVLKLAKAQTLPVSDLDGNIQHISNIQKIQLAAANTPAVYELPANSRVVMTCELFSAHTMYHFTDVLCDVKNFKLSKKRQKP